jgi:hypothetical protein
LYFAVLLQYSRACSLLLTKEGRGNLLKLLLRERERENIISLERRVSSSNHLPPGVCE